MGEFSLWRRENPASNCKRQLCCKQIPLAGPDASTPAREKGLQPSWGDLCTSEVIRRFPKGNGGKRVPSGHNRRRRLAPRSSGKQQAERTAVRTAPIVCPEESPLARPQAHPPCLGGVRRVEFGTREKLATLMGDLCTSEAIRRGCRGRAESHPACIDKRQLCRKQFPPVGPDAPTPARIGTCRPKGRSHFSFGGERKVCKRKPAARRLREKALYCPF